MFRLMCCLSAISLALAQSGTNYQTSDGQLRRETIDPQGNVRGQYSYLDSTGKTITVNYSAGKDGFQVEGDHLPRNAEAPAGVAPQLFRQLPAAPQFSQFLPGTSSQFETPHLASQQDSRLSQQALFAPARSFGQAASRGQVAQFGQEQAPQLPPQPAPLQFSARSTPQFSALPPPSGQFPTGPQFLPPTQQQQYAPQLQTGAQFGGSPSFTSPGSPFSGRLDTTQLTQLGQQGPVTFPTARSQLLNSRTETTPGQLSVSQDPSGAYRYQFAFGQ